LVSRQQNLPRQSFGNYGSLFRVAAAILVGALQQLFCVVRCK